MELAGRSVRPFPKDVLYVPEVPNKKLFTIVPHIRGRQRPATRPCGTGDSNQDKVIRETLRMLYSTRIRRWEHRIAVK